MPELKPTSDVVRTARQEDTTVVVAIRGEIDLHNSAGLRTDLLDFLAKTKPKKLILNLADVPYMDSSAIAVLVEALQKIRKVQGKIVLTNLQPRVKGLLEIARLDSIFGVTGTEAEAMAK